MNRHIDRYCYEMLKDKDTVALKQHAQLLKKGRSALEFYFMLENGIKFSVSKWGKRWGVSTGTASKWVAEFEEVYRQYTVL